MKLVLPFLVAVITGFALGWIASRALQAPTSKPNEREVESRAAVEHASPAKLTEPAGEPAIAETRASSTRAAEGLISDALRKYALEELDAGWHETRQDPLPEPLLTRGFNEFEAAVRKLPREIGRNLAKELTQTERLASDDPFTVIEAMYEGRLGPQIDLIHDEKRFAGFFACTDGPRVDGIALALAREPVAIPPGTVIVFPAGVYDIEFLTRNFRASTRCVTIAGAGMDQTLLQFRTIQPNEKLDRFEVRDCTLQSQCDAIALNAKAGVWRAERVRFIGFDCGAGSSSVFSVMRGAILELKSCRIEGGFGRNPEFGNLMDLRTNAFLARFDDCTITTLRSNLQYLSQGSTLILRRCRLEDLLDSDMPFARKGSGLVLESTTIELRPKDAAKLEKRDLAELFPAWIQPTKR